MYNSSKFILFTLMLFSLTGCIISRPVNKTLAPSSDTKWVNIEIKNPSQYTEPFPLGVRYISSECKKKRISGFDGSVISEPSYNVIRIPMQQEDGDIWKAKVAMTGGGSCKWSLSAVTLGISYTDATHLGKDLVPGIGAGVTLAFDSDASRNGQYRFQQGDFILSPRYYPYIIEWKFLSNVKELTLLGKSRFISYYVENLSDIKFSPFIDEGKIIRYIEPEKKLEGVHSRIIYPDSSIVSDGTVFPSFDKVDKMKVGK